MNTQLSIDAFTSIQLLIALHADHLLDVACRGDIAEIRALAAAHSVSIEQLTDALDEVGCISFEQGGQRARGEQALETVNMLRDYYL